MKIFLVGLILLTITFSGLSTKEKKNNKERGVILLTYNGYKTIVPLYGKMNPTKSNLLQQDQILIQKGVASYFKNFDVIVTTDDSLFYTFPENKRVRCVITSDTLKLRTSYGIILAGGISVYNSLYLNDTTPVLVSIPNIERFDFIPTVISHEVAHAIGLAHQSLFNKSIKLMEYRIGDSLVGPIMGNSMRSKESKWYKGTNSFGQYQDDEEVISRTFPRLK